MRLERHGAALRLSAKKSPQTASRRQADVVERLTVVESCRALVPRGLYKAREAAPSRPCQCAA
jgi:hypothetical protein